MAARAARTSNILFVMPVKPTATEGELVRRLMCWTLLAAALGYSATGEAVTAQTPGTPATAWVIFGTDTIRAEVARSPEERQRGLMFRDAVPDGTGMLFVFERPSVQDIWMKDTFVPLDVAFLDASFRVVNIESLEPLDLTTKSSAAPVLFALEVPQGWFSEHGVESGRRAVIEFGRR